jgi:hypothetical protein
MASWITTKQILLRQDEKSLQTGNQENGELGRPTGNIYNPWAQQCITTGVKMSPYRPRLANASWTHSSFPPQLSNAAVVFHSCLPQFSSTDILIMAAKDMNDALQNPHPEVLFAHVGDDTISTLTELANILNSN